MNMAHTEDSLDEQFEILSHPVRRRILTTLVRNREGQVFSIEEFATEDDSMDASLTSLHHFHLPKLVASEFVEWDRRTGTVTSGLRYDEIAPLVELLIANEDELPADWP